VSQFEVIDAIIISSTWPPVFINLFCMLIKKEGDDGEKEERTKDRHDSVLMTAGSCSNELHKASSCSTVQTKVRHFCSRSYEIL
jgi:hypothetical protein